MIIYYNKISYNICNNCEAILIIIIKSSKFKNDYKKLKKKHMDKELDKLSKVEELIIESDSMKNLMLNPLHIIYNIEKKNINLKEIYTARLNGKLRLYMKSCCDYPYNNLENIIEIEFIEIDDKHYEEG